MSAGKRRRQEPIRDSSDSEEGDDSIYDLNWEPEEGSVFKVPLHEFYNTLSEIPERFKDARDWTTECLVGTLQGTKRSNKASEGLLYGIKFDDGLSGLKMRKQRKYLVLAPLAASTASGTQLQQPQPTPECIAGLGGVWRWNTSDIIHISVY